MATNATSAAANRARAPRQRPPTTRGPPALSAPSPNRKAGSFSAAANWETKTDIEEVTLMAEKSLAEEWLSEEDNRWDKVL
jgi:hypothetical protein